MAIIKTTINPDYTAVPQQGDLSLDDNIKNGRSNGLTPHMYADTATAQICKSEEAKIGVSEDDADHQCSWGPCAPSVCQRFRNAKWICFWLCWAGAIQGMVVNGFINVVISNIERRYDFSSTVSGTISSCYDIASVLCLIPVSYFGGLGSKPRYLGIGVFIMGMGSIVFSLPQFISDTYIVDNYGDKSTCGVSENETMSCDLDNAPVSLSNYKYIFFIGQLLHGAGAAPLYTLGATYLDENVPPRSSSFYLGIFFALTIIGPAIGYLAGGVFLNIYVDLDVTSSQSLTLTPDSPRWVGAWWIGFLISATLAFIVSFPLGGFPKLLPGSEQYKLEREKEVYSKSGREPKYVNNEEEEPAISYKQVIKSVKILVTNPTFMFLNLAAACEGLLLSGIATFVPKFIEAQFALSASTAAQYVGYAAIPAGGGGTFLGGYLVKKFDLHVKGIIRLCVGLSAAAFFTAFVFLIHCGNSSFAGVNIEYGTQNRSTSVYNGDMTSTCNSHCSCNPDLYNPICGIDNVIYYNPCYAGCTEENIGEERKTYSNCSCIMYDPSIDHQYEAEEGKCKTGCQYLPVFMPICAILILLTFTTSMPALSVTLRCVPNAQKSFALGIQWIIARCLGSIPGPILFGNLIDMTCKLWQTRCEEKGSCFFYDNRQMSLNMMGIILSAKSLSTVFFFVALFLYKKPAGSNRQSDDTKEETPPPPPKALALSPNCKSNQSVHTAVTLLSDSLPTTPATPSNHTVTNWSHL
ncbi:Solute carrier organic anion transporter [Mactra antiquata]